MQLFESNPPVALSDSLQLFQCMMLSIFTFFRFELEKGLGAVQLTTGKTQINIGFECVRCLRRKCCLGKESECDLFKVEEVMVEVKVFLDCLS